MNSFVARRLSIACLAIATSACGSDRVTAPDAAFSAAVRSAAPIPFSVGATSPTTIDVRWTDNSPNETGFEVHRSLTGASGTFTLRQTAPAGVELYTDGELAPHTLYCYKVRSVRSRRGTLTYSDFTPAECATTPGPPPAPTAFSAIPRTDTVALTWTGAVEASGYSVERLEPGASLWVHRATTSQTSYTDSWYWTETQLCYRVSAHNQWGRSASANACVVPPAAPSGLVVAAGSAGTLDLAWEDNSAVETGHEIQRATADMSFVTVGTAPANARSFSDASASTDIRYWYRVRATVNGGGYSRFSETASGLKPSVPPAAPRDASAVATGSESVRITWSDGSTNEQSYRVERTADGGSSWTSVGTVDWWTLELTDYGATAERESCYRVFAVNSGGDSPASATDCTIPPAAPANLVAVTAGTGEIDLSWSDLSGVEDGYVIQRLYCYYYDYYGSRCDAYPVGSVGPGVTTWRDSGLYAGAWQEYQVVAFRNEGTSSAYSSPSNSAGANAGP